MKRSLCIGLIGVVLFILILSLMFALGLLLEWMVSWDRNFVALLAFFISLALTVILSDLVAKEMWGETK